MLEGGFDEESSKPVGSDARYTTTSPTFCEDDTMYGVFMGPTTEHEEGPRSTLEHALAKTNDIVHSQEHSASESRFELHICETTPISDAPADGHGVPLDNSSGPSPEADDSSMSTIPLRSLRPRKRVTLSPVKHRLKIMDKSVRNSLPHFPTTWSSIPSNPSMATPNAHGSTCGMVPDTENDQTSPVDSPCRDSVDLISDGLTGASLNSKGDIPPSGKENAEATHNARASILADTDTNVILASTPGPSHQLDQIWDCSPSLAVNAPEPGAHSFLVPTSDMDDTENGVVLSIRRQDGRQLVSHTIPELTPTKKQVLQERLFVHLQWLPRRIWSRIII